MRVARVRGYIGGLLERMSRGGQTRSNDHIVSELSGGGYASELCG